MNTVTWNAVAQAYDEKFEVLEKARAEYVQVIKSLLGSIAGKIIAEPVIETNADFFVLNQTPLQTCEEIHPAAAILKYSVPTPGGNFHVLVRFSSPCYGPQGLLQFIIVSDINSKWTLELRDFADADKLVRGQNTIERSSTDWIYAEAITLKDVKEEDLVTTAGETLRSMLRLAVRLLAKFRKECIEYRMMCLLVECKDRLDARLDKDEKINRCLPSKFTFEDWNRQRCLQMNPHSGRPSFWVAYELDRCSLMFGNNQDEAAPENFQVMLQAALQEKIRAGSWEEYGAVNEWRPQGGTIMDREKLCNPLTSDEEILEVIITAFKTFAEVVVESTAQGD